MGGSGMVKRVADVLVETLQAVGVKRCYGIVGDTLNDGSVKADLSVPRASGRPGKPGTSTPEHLFAAPLEAISRSN
jgi:organic hydroperoxide reductase OsmC/OhrA